MRCASEGSDKCSDKSSDNSSDMSASMLASRASKSISVLKPGGVMMNIGLRGEGNLDDDEPENIVRKTNRKLQIL